MQIKKLVNSYGIFLPLAILVVPRVELFGIDGVNSKFRLDTISQFFLTIFLDRNKVLYIFVLTCLSLSAIHVTLGSNIFIELSGWLLIFSCYGAFHLGLKTDKRWMINALVLTNIILVTLHLVGCVISPFHSTFFYLKYGMFHMPFMYGFVLIINFVFIFEFEKRLNIKAAQFFIVSFGILIGENRTCLIALIGLLLFYGLKNISNVIYVKRIEWRYLLLLIIFLVFFVLFFDEYRAANILKSILSFDLNSIFSDPSFQMRVNNYSRAYSYYFNLDTMNYYLSLIFGRGFFSFLEYAMQFGAPGHFDSLYARVLAENGLVGLVLLLGAMVSLVKISMGAFIIVFVTSFNSEALLAIKTSAFAAFVIGSMVKSRRDSLNNDE